jgi:hypothetical protein
MSQVTQPISVRRVRAGQRFDPGLAFVPPVALVAVLAAAVACVLLFEVFFLGRIFPYADVGTRSGWMRPAEARWPWKRASPIQPADDCTARRRPYLEAQPARPGL